MSTKKQTAKTEAAVAIQPKPQIPTMLAALRREREKARLLLEALESKLAPVMRAADEIPTGIPISVRWDKAAPIVETLDESVNIFAALNARIKDVTARLEI